MRHVMWVPPFPKTEGFRAMRHVMWVPPFPNTEGSGPMLFEDSALPENGRILGFKPFAYAGLLLLLLLSLFRFFLIPASSLSLVVVVVVLLLLGSCYSKFFN